MRTVPLPKRQEGDEYIYYEPGLAPGSWWTDTVQVDNVPKVLSCLDMALPVPFENTQTNGCQPPGASPNRPIPLPKRTGR